MARNGWPECPVIYEIYPRSFLDTTGTGQGDLHGIHQKLDYVASLNVDAIWIAPFYPSPLQDGGYDIADHSAIDPALGDFEIFDSIVARAHELGLKVMIDQVLNHTSRAHRWFAKSIAREAGFDDWYVWSDPKPDGSLPNNWMSYFGSPAWTWNHRRQQYFWHQFSSYQPKLNLRNPAVQKAHADQMKMWRNRGVDGFRMDAISSYLHDEGLRDNPPASPKVRNLVGGPRFSPYAYQAHIHDMLPGDGASYCENIRRWAGPDMYLLGEINAGNHSIGLSNSFTEANRLDAVYTIDFTKRGFTAAVIADVLSGLERIGDIAMWLSSHDQARHLSAMGDGSADEARFLALACASLPGPWMIYQGEELGLPQPELSQEDTRDPFDLAFWPDGPGREGARVPLPWKSRHGVPRNGERQGRHPGESGNNNYGFSEGDPWLPMRWSEGSSVSEQEANRNSVLHFYRKVVSCRRQHDWASGKIQELNVNGDVLEMRLGKSAGNSAMHYTVVLNFGDEATAGVPQSVPLITSVTPGSDLNSLLPARSAAIWLSRRD